MATPDALSVTRTSEPAQDLRDAPLKADRNKSGETAERPEHQLHLRLFMRLEQWKGDPPERALWRELLDLAGAFIDAKAHHAAWCMYSRADKTGVIEKYSLKALATDMRASEATAKRAVANLRKARIVKSKRYGRRSGCYYQMNIGGLKWTTVMERFSKLCETRKTAKLPFCIQLKLNPADFVESSRVGSQGPYSDDRVGSQGPHCSATSDSATPSRPVPETATTPVVVSGKCEKKKGARSNSAHARGDRAQSTTDTARPNAAPRDDVFSRDPETTKSRKADTEPARVRTVEVDPEDREFFKVARRRRRERQAASAAAWTMTPPDPNPADPRRASVRQVALIRKLTRRFNQQHPTEEEARGLTGAQADKTIRLLTDLERTAGIAPTAQPSIAAALPATVRTAPAAGPAATERAARVETCPHPAADRATDGPFCNRCGATVEA